MYEGNNNNDLNLHSRFSFNQNPEWISDQYLICGWYEPGTVVDGSVTDRVYWVDSDKWNNKSCQDKIGFHTHTHISQIHLESVSNKNYI